MENIRNFGVQNRSTVITTIYVVAVLILVWFIIRFYFAGVGMDKTLLGAKMEANVQRAYTIADKDALDIQMKTGGEYTISMWLYIRNWDTKTQRVFEVMGHTARKSALVAGFYPNEPKMYIRSEVIYTGNNGAPPQTTNENTLPDCDVVDIPVQRWVHLTVSVNGRIMDVYLDGKLARSCILPNVQTFANVNQGIRMFPFDGFYSGIHYQAYAATPDEIYSMYASGPYSATGFLDFLMEKIGIKVVYTA
jgi:hypothetical protein